MEQRTEETLSPYRIFPRTEWARLRADTPMTLSPAEVGRLRSVHDRLDMREVEEIYLPLSRLLSFYVDVPLLWQRTLIGAALLTALASLLAYAVLRRAPSVAPIDMAAPPSA